MLRTRKDLDGAEKATRGDRGDDHSSEAHHQLGLLLEEEREDYDGAVQAYKDAMIEFSEYDESRLKLATCMRPS